jgi:hypothetical protein
MQLKIYDVLGREVSVLVNENLSAGKYEVDWNAESFSGGVYYYKIIVCDPSSNVEQSFTETRKMILIK